MALLRMEGITKTFPGVVANDSVSLDLEPGEVHALVGENGAGKTTLMKILYGLYKPDAGKIFVDDQPTVVGNPRDAIRKGIGMVHQHFMLVPVFSVLDNIVLGQEEPIQEQPRPFLDRLKDALYRDTEAPRERIEKLMRDNRLQIDLDKRVGDLPVGIQQRVEILKILYRGARALVFDEPTAVLTPQEVEELFRTFEELSSQGKGIVFITHKLDEVLRVADRITVIRRGKIIRTMPREGATKSKIAELMVGKPVLLKVDNPPAEPGEAVLKVENLNARDDRGAKVLSDINLEVRAGEIVGVAGVEGNGQSELVRAVSQKMRLEGGEILLNGESILEWDIRKRREAGIAHIPEDRQRYGLLLPFSLADNLVLGRHHQPPFVNALQFRRHGAVRAFAREAIEQFDIRTPSEVTTAEALSGGNQQKVIVARELASEPRLLLATQPTRGVDIGAQEFIYKQLVEAKRAGKAVLVVSADLDEVLTLSDRICVMYQGKIVHRVSRAEATKEGVGYYMMGEGTDGEKSA